MVSTVGIQKDQKPGQFTFRQTIIGQIEEESYERKNTNSSGSAKKQLISRADLSEEDDDCNPFASNSVEESKKEVSDLLSEEDPDCDVEDNSDDHITEQLKPSATIKANAIATLEKQAKQRM